MLIPNIIYEESIAQTNHKFNNRFGIRSNFYKFIWSDVRHFLLKGFTKIPNVILRTQKLDPYDKLILFLISSCGSKAFPSITKLCEWSTCSRPRVIKSLKKLELNNFIQRYKSGKSVYYKVHWDDYSGLPQDAIAIRYGASIGKRQIHTSKRRLLTSVNDVYPIKTTYKELLKRDKNLSNDNAEQSKSKTIESISDISEQLVKSKLNKRK